MDRVCFGGEDAPSAVAQPTDGTDAPTIDDMNVRTTNEQQDDGDFKDDGEDDFEDGGDGWAMDEPRYVERKEYEPEVKDQLVPVRGNEPGLDELGHAGDDEAKTDHSTLQQYELDNLNNQRQQQAMYPPPRSVCASDPSNRPDVFGTPTPMPSELRRVCIKYVGSIPQQYFYDTRNRFHCEIDRIGLGRGFDATPIVADLDMNHITSAHFALPGVAGYSDASEFIDDKHPRSNAQSLKAVCRVLLSKYVISGGMKCVSPQGCTTVSIDTHLIQDIIDSQLLKETAFDTVALLDQYLQERIRGTDRAGYVCTPSHGRRFVLIDSGLHHGRTGEVLYVLCVPDDFASTNNEWQLVRLVTARDIQLFC